MENLKNKEKPRGGGRAGAGRKIDSIRQHFEKIEKHGNFAGYKCRICNVTVSSKACRMKMHFSKCSQAAKSSRMVAVSSEESAESGSELDCHENVTGNKTNTINKNDREVEDEVQKTPSSKQLKRKAVQEIYSGMAPTTWTWQPKIDLFLYKTTSTEKDKIDYAIAQFFYSCNVPFSHSERFYFKNMISLLRPGYIPPNRKKLGGELLDKVTTSMYEEAKKRLNGKSVTLIQDGWSAIHNDPVIASCVSDGEKSYFLSSLETETNHKTSEYCLELAINGIEEAEQKFGCKVKSFVSDNEAKMKKMREALQEKINDNKDNHNEFHFIAYGCAAHYLNLLGQDICKTKNINNILKQITEVSKFFRNHHVAKGHLAKQEGSRIPQLPGETRWNSQLDCLEVFLLNREFYLKIIENHEDDVLPNITNIIENVGLMKEAKYLFKQLKPISCFLDRVQSESSNISDALFEFLSLKKLCSKNELLHPYESLINKRFNDLITPAHIIAFMLNPKYIEELDNLDADLQEMARKWIREDVDENFLPLLLQFNLKSQPFPETFFVKTVIETLTPIEWWKAVSKNVTNKKFCEFALHLFRCIASSASIERIFSNFSYIQSKLRNRLGLEKASRLVMAYKMLNMNIKGKDKEPPPEPETN